ncbi:MAG: FliH/SctL family protein [Candidatus Goldiibacteriota bacterium]
MYKNIFKTGDYDLSDEEYKLRNVYLPKTAVKPAEKKKEKTPEEKLEDLNARVKETDALLREKQNELEELKKEYGEMTGKAEKDAESIMQKAREEAEALKEEKSKQGYEEGFEKGRGEGAGKGKEEAEEKYSLLVKRLESITEKAASEKAKIINETEKEIVDLAAGIAKKVVINELKTDRKIIIEHVKEAIMRLEDKEKIYIYCHPEDLELVKSHRDDFENITDLVEALHIHPDDMLDPGECRLESKTEIIDTDIENQFGEIKKKLSAGE